MFSAATKTAQSSSAGPADPYFYYDTLLLNGDGTNGAQNNTFLDSSTNNFTITRNGNTTQGSFSPYGNLWSNYFASSSLATPSNAAVSNTLLASDFTIECWFFAPSGGANGSALWTNSTTNSDGFTSSYIYADGSIGTGKVAVNQIVSATGLWTVSTWNHFALVRSGSNLTIYLNGTQIVTTSSASTYLNTSATKPMAIGRNYQTSPTYFNGYISNFRAVSSALYTTTFTPSTTPLTAISGTQLLTCQSNRFVDNSSNAFAITAGGTPSVQRFSPFNPTAPYSTSVIGGSGYFGTAGDYLVTTSSQVIPTGSYTIEAWVYTTSTSQTQAILAQGTGVGDANRTTIGIETNSGAVWSAQVGASSVLSSFAVVPNTWTHVAMTFNGTTITLWINGVSAGSTASVLNASNTTLQVGKNWGSYQWIGYISNARVSNTVRYTATFTPQTTPFTSDANTTFLGGMTNAGIPDLAMQNDLQTVGNAQVSTSVKKYGTGSIYFDGSSGDYLTTPPNTYGWNFGTGNFTVELWIYPIAATNRTIMADRAGSTGTANAWSLEFFNTALRVEWHTGLAIIASSNTNITLNVWSHIAVVRNSGTLTIYQNGTSVASVSDSNNYSEVNPLNIGYEPVFPSGNSNFYGYMDDIRITNGYARYVSNFTPPTAALPIY